MAGQGKAGQGRAGQGRAKSRAGLEEKSADSRGLLIIMLFFAGGVPRLVKNTKSEISIKARETAGVTLLT